LKFAKYLVFLTNVTQTTKIHLSSVEKGLVFASTYRDDTLCFHIRT